MWNNTRRPEYDITEEFPRSIPTGTWKTELSTITKSNNANVKSLKICLIEGNSVATKQSQWITTCPEDLFFWLNFILSISGPQQSLLTLIYLACIMLSHVSLFSYILCLLNFNSFKLHGKSGNEARWYSEKLKLLLFFWYMGDQPCNEHIARAEYLIVAIEFI